MDQPTTTSSEIKPVATPSDQMVDTTTPVDRPVIVAPVIQISNRSSVAMFSAVGIVFILTLMIFFKGGPATAAAATSAKDTNEAINEFLTTGSERLRRMQAMLKDTEKLVHEFLSYPNVAQVPLSALRNNPFRMSSTNMSAPVDEAAIRRRRDEERQTVLNAVQGLQLQSIIHTDSRRACLINNALYREGQQVENFTIERIDPKAVVVRSGAYRFELQMQR